MILVSEVQSASFFNEIYEKFHDDYRDYDSNFLCKQLNTYAEKFNYGSYNILVKNVFGSKIKRKLLYEMLLVDVSDFFRDRNLFLYIRNSIIPYLSSYAKINIWCAGIAKGEEPYSLAIMLYEAGLYEKCIIYATDSNSDTLAKAAKGEYKLQKALKASQNYYLSGGEDEFEKYYTLKDNSIVISDFIKKNIVFTKHNLVSDDVFINSSLILCRNVLIYFNDKLKDRVYNLFGNSLEPSGFLILGSAESLPMASKKFKSINTSQKVYKHNIKPL